MKDDQPEVSVRLKRHTGNQVLVIVRGDPDDEEPTYFHKLTSEGRVGFWLNPLGDPHEISIDDGGIYGGEFILLGPSIGGFSARLPQALIDLLLPNDAVEATYPCQVESGEWHLFFTLPEGGSLLSLFFKDLPPSQACEAPVGTCTDASLASV